MTPNPIFFQQQLLQQYNRYQQATSGILLQPIDPIISQRTSFAMLWIPRYHMFKWLDTVYHSHICYHDMYIFSLGINTFGDLGSILHLPFFYFSSCSLAQICYDDIIRISYISYVHNSYKHIICIPYLHPIFVCQYVQPELECIFSLIDA